jgi:A/G-specific adenine glycosylase
MSFFYTFVFKLKHCTSFVMTATPTKIHTYPHELKTWFSQEKRDLPWRTAHPGQRSPYYTWISEIMLQQTRVETVREYFIRWIERFPDIFRLAQAKEEEVLQLWQGLGYYSRARNIHKCAQIIVQQHQGKFPQTRKELEALPGIGPYTAGAILSLAFTQKEALLDGNLIRIFSRLYGWNFLADTTLHKNTYWQAAKLWAQDSQSGVINEALMELGALVCTPKQQLCAECPFMSECYAYKNDVISLYPPTKNKREKITLQGSILLIEHKNSFLLYYNEDANSLLKQQYALPWNIPSEQVEQLQRYCTVNTLSTPVKHAITHHKILQQIDLIHWAKDTSLLTDILQFSSKSIYWATPAEMTEKLVSSLFIKTWKIYLKQIQHIQHIQHIQNGASS